MPTSLPAIVIVIAMLGFVATAVRPSVETAQREQVETRSQELAELFRFAARESRLSNRTIGVSFDSANGSFSVVEADMSTQPFNRLGVVNHPISKQPYIWQADANVQTLTTTPPFNFGTQGDYDRVAFDRWGTPFIRVGDQNHPLQLANITLTGNRHARRINIARITGRVQVL